VSPQIAFLLQVALILGMARLLGEMLRRVNQPPVLGELLAGIVLGPSLLGIVWPQGFQAVFADQTALTHLSTVGLILLMLLTGLETDVRVMRNMGRAAFAASVFGMLVPFASGLLLGAYLDERFVTQHGRPLLALFMATTLAISAMPVIAKILLDLNMMKRNFGIVILSAAVVDDTVGWIVLAFISGVATGGGGGLASGHLLLTIGLLAVFIVGAIYVLYPFLRWLLPRAEHELRVPGSELVVVVVVGFLCAAATEGMHVHAVFGAFVAGVVFRQCPTLSAENLQRLESVTMALFTPLFFGAVGLSVDLTTVNSVWLPAVVLLVAIVGKVAGCFIGGIVGRLPVWESLALGLGMSARGAMGLVVAIVGLRLGILTPELFSALVLMALVTSLLAPLTLKAIAHKLPLSEEEKLREKGAAPGFVPTGQLRILVPASGGENALVGCHLAAHLCRSDGDRSTILHVESARRRWWQRGLSNGRPTEGFDSEAYFRRIQSAAGRFASRLSPRKIPASGSVLESILEEARKNYHFLIVGASGHRHPLYDPFISELVRRNPCHLVVVANRSGVPGDTAAFRRILVPTNGSYFTDTAVEFAAQYAESTDAQLTVLYVTEGEKRNPLLPAAAVEGVADHVLDAMKITLREQYGERISRPDRLECLVRESQSLVSAMVEELQAQKYDLVVLGAENKRFVERLYLGQHIETAITEASCTIALVIPKVGR
jgi:Kef-type K+ transport system membrane component KefB/nucleotide-binding universal stress UspA family protein